MGTAAYAICQRPCCMTWHDPPVVWPQGRVRWAMAGRSESKLREVRQSLSKINPQCAVSGTA
eukprot:361929-Chlamydomonas_euryale.AAC.8